MKKKNAAAETVLVLEEPPAEIGKRRGRKKSAQREYDEQQEMVRELGIDTSRLKRISFQLNTLRKHGVLVDISIRGTHMFTGTADKLEIGIINGSNRDRRYSSPRKYYIPKKIIDELNSVETQMRNSLRNNSYSVRGFYPFVWVPSKAFLGWQEEWNRLKVRFEEIKAKILANYDEYRSMLMQEIAAGAKETWDTFREDEVLRGIEYRGQVYHSEAAYVDAVVETTLAKFPTVEKIQNELVADWVPGYIVHDVDIAVEQARALEVQAKMEAKLRKQQEELERQRELSQIELEQKRIELEKQRKEHAAMMQIVREQLEKQLSEMEMPLNEIIKALRDRIAELAQEMIDSIRENGFLKGQIAKKVEEMLKLYNSLAQFDDDELYSLIMEVKQLIGPVGKARTRKSPPRDINAIVKSLKDIVHLADNEESIRKAGHRAAFIELD